MKKIMGKTKILISALVTISLILNQSVFSSYELTQSQNARIVSPLPGSTLQLEKGSELKVSGYADPDKKIIVTVNMNILEALELYDSGGGISAKLGAESSENSSSIDFGLENEKIVINTMSNEYSGIGSETYQIPNNSNITLNGCKSYKLGNSDVENSYAKNLLWEIVSGSGITITGNSIDSCINELTISVDDSNVNSELSYTGSVTLRNSSNTKSTKLNLDLQISDTFQKETGLYLGTAPGVITVGSGMLIYRFTNLAQGANENYDHIIGYDLSAGHDECGGGDISRGGDISTGTVLFDEDVHRNYISVNQPALIKMEMTGGKKGSKKYEDYTIFNFPWGASGDNDNTVKLYLASIDEENYDPSVGVPYAYFGDNKKQELGNTIKNSFKIKNVENQPLAGNLDLNGFSTGSYIGVFLLTTKTDEDGTVSTSVITSNKEIKINEDGYELIDSPKKYLNIAYDDEVISDSEVGAFNTTFVLDDLIIPSRESFYILEATYLTEASLSRNEQSQSVGTDSRPSYLKSCVSTEASDLIVTLSDPYGVFYDSWTKKIISNHSIFFEVKSTFTSQNATLPLVKPFYIKGLSDNGRYSILTPPGSFEINITHMMPGEADIEDDNFKNKENFRFPSEILNDNTKIDKGYYEGSPDYTEIYLGSSATNGMTPIKKFKNIIHRDVPVDPAIWGQAEPGEIIKIYNDNIEYTTIANGEESTNPGRFSFFVNKGSYKIEYSEKDDEKTYEDIAIEGNIIGVSATPIN